MKYVIAIAVCFMLLAGCIRYHSEKNWHGNASLIVKESDDHYKLDARFKHSVTGTIERIIDTELYSNAGYYEGNEMNGFITLKDDSKIYLKLRSGRLKIRLNKEESSEAAYERIKQISEQIKLVITSN